MRKYVFRVTAVGMTALVAAAFASSAFGAHGHGYGPRMGVRTFGPGSFGPGGLGIGFGGPMGGPGGFLGARGGFAGHGGPGGGGGVFASDVLTPAASFLGISVSTLTSDLNGGKTLAQEATAKGKTAADLITAIVAAEKTNLDNQKAAGWITADQETALLQQYTAQVTSLVNNGPGVPPGGGPQGGLLQTAATFLGMSVSDVQSALKSGKSLADLATSKGKTASDLVTALLAPAKTKLDQAVTDGKITSAQEQTILTNLTTRLTNLVNNTKPTSTSSQMTKLQKGVATLTSLKTFTKRH